MKRLGWLGLVSLVIGAAGANCIQVPEDTTKERVAALKGFNSADELRTYLADQAKVRYWGTNRSSGLGFFGSALGGLAPTAAEDTANNASSNGDSGTQSDPFSTTTIQEEGVDESDIVKNDGQFIYVLDGSTVHIVLASPPAGLVELSTINVEPDADSMYLHGDKLIVLSRYNNYYYYAYGDMPALVDSGSAEGSSGSSPAIDPVIGATFRDGVQTTVTIIDLADRSNPTVAATVRLEGNLADSRLIDHLLYVVLTATPRLPDSLTQANISAMPLEDWIPNFEMVDAEGTMTSGDLAGWQDFYRPENPDGYGLTAVITLDVDAPTTTLKSTVISADVSVVYASPQALYVADTNYDYSSSTSRTDTAIHKLAFTTEGTTYVGSGLVPGRPMNQYSLGEYQGYLRVATHIEEYNGVFLMDDVAVSNVSSSTATSAASTTAPRYDNNVYVLGESAGALAIVGRLEGLAPNEQMYSARFVGKRGFLVTFRRVDPLFTLDLSDPTQPRVAGELIVPGYSDFIQPMDENHLLTIGKGAQVSGDWAWIQGIKLAIFDVTDAANPTLLHEESIGGRGSSSEANYNPKAFNYFPAREALAFPADVYDLAGGGASWGQHTFTGLYVYRVNVTDGFDLLGRIASSEEVPNNGCFWGYYGFTRGVFIGDTVYAVTERSVKAADLSAVDTLIGTAVLANPPSLIQDCFGVPTIELPAGTGLR